jgi:hypothetical protein
VVWIGCWKYCTEKVARPALKIKISDRKQAETLYFQAQQALFFKLKHPCCSKKRHHVCRFFVGRYPVLI